MSAKIRGEHNPENDPVEDLIRAGRELWIRGLVSGISGNLSLGSREHIFITCSGACKGRLQAADIIRIKRDTAAPIDPGRVSSEAKMHLAVYAARPEAGAVVHVHPPHLLALDQAGARLLDMDLFEAAQVRRQLDTVPPLPPGSEELAQAVGDAAREARAVCMSKHGLTCWAEALDQALSLAEEVEALAKIQLLTGVCAREK